MLGSTGSSSFVITPTMNDTDLSRRLAALKSVAPDPAWVAKNRAVLSSQISNGTEYAEIKLGFFANISLFSRRLTQPASIAILIVAFFATAFAGVSASQKAKPGDPLYIAKTISEKARLVTEVNEKNKAMLNLEFARQRASEFERIAEANADDPRLKDLSASFKSELAAARTRLLTKPVDPTETISAPTPAAAQPDVEAKESETVTATATPAPDEKVMIADSKDSKEEVSSIPEALDQAEKLFDQKDYDAAIEALNGISLP